MHSVGIICEYNPFHNGHLYHLQKAKEIANGAPIILVLGTSFTERGDISILTKWEKTRLSLLYGVDLVIELPFAFATQSADIFAKGAIEILMHLKCDTLVFGMETDDISKLEKLVDVSLFHKDYDSIVRSYLQKGLNYPTSLSNALKDILGYTVNTPNDLLAFSYLKELKKNNYQMQVIPIKRTNSYHDTTLQEIASATAIRKNLENLEEVKKSVPKETFELLKDKNKNYDDLFFQFLKYKVLSEKDNIRVYQTVEEGLEHKIQKEIISSSSLEELIYRMKTKRYTYNKLRRMCLHILCSFTKEEAKKWNHITYLKILGFSNKGRVYLSKVKKEIQIPIITKMKKSDYSLLYLDLKVNQIYQLITGTNETENQVIYYK